jgi:putative ABC transport system permease protein
MKVPDLSLESAYMLGGLSGAYAVGLCVGMPVYIVIPLVIGASMISGACVGFTSSLITRLIGIPHLLSSIITFGIYHGISQMLFGVYRSLSVYANPLITAYSLAHYPELFMISGIGIGAILCSAFLLRTSLGNCFAVYGQNPNFFSHYDISTGYIFVLGIVIANAFAGLSGYLIAQSSGFADMNMAIGKILLCVTALILARVLVPARVPSVWYPIVGVTVYFIIQHILLKSGFNLKYFTMVQALLVLAVLAVLYRRHAIHSTDQVGV